jgi:hypothetical protein
MVSANPETNLQRYDEFRPTGFDAKGLAAGRMGHDEDDSDRSQWFVAPCSITRDSGALDRANWVEQERALKEADPDSESNETHRFGHWACGWFELVLVRPGTKAADVAAELAAVLRDYPVLCEERLSAIEHEEESADWTNYGAADFARAIKRALGLCEDNADRVDDLSPDELFGLFRQVNGPDRSHYEGNGWSFDDTAGKRVTAKILAVFLKSMGK